MPAAPRFQRARFGLRSNTQVFVSPLNGSVQTVELPGARWFANYQLPPLAESEANLHLWKSFLVSLRGPAGRFYGFDPAHLTPRGAATGTPLVNGASQTGTAPATDGWTINITGILKDGDLIAFDTSAGRELHMQKGDVNSNASGQATLTLEPPIRTAPADNATIVVASPSCVMMLAQPDVEWEIDEALFHGLSFDAVEAII